MSGAVFVETLRRGWRTMIYWGIGMGLYGGIIILMLPDVNALKQAADLIASMPPFIVKMVGGDDITFMTTPEGFLATKFFLFAPIMFGIYVINAGLNVTSSDEDRGIMDITLSLPVRRWRILIERLLGYAVLLTGIVLITFLSLVISNALSPTVNIATGVLFQATINVLPSMLLLLTFTVLAGAALPRRSTGDCRRYDLLDRQLRDRPAGQHGDGVAGGEPAGDLVLPLLRQQRRHAARLGARQRADRAGGRADLRRARALLLRTARHRGLSWCGFCRNLGYLETSKVGAQRLAPLLLF